MRLPKVNRCPLNGGLTIDCARDWYKFLSEEADWNNAGELAQVYKRRSQGLSHGLRGSYHDGTLEQSIRTYRELYNV